MQTIDIAPADWITTEQAAKILKKNPRTVQAMAKDGRLKSKPAGPPHANNARLYEAAEVLRTAELANGLRRTPKRSEPEQNAPPSTAVAVRNPKPSQGDRALDTVSIVGKLVVSHKDEMEMLAGQFSRSLETVASLILNSQKAEADANRERLKAEREDARERWELERQDRLNRQKNRGLALVPSPPPEKPKVKRAHA